MYALEVFVIKGKDFTEYASTKLNKSYYIIELVIGKVSLSTKLDVLGGSSPEWNTRLNFENLKTPDKYVLVIKCHLVDWTNKKKLIAASELNLNLFEQLEDHNKQKELDGWFKLYGIVNSSSSFNNISQIDKKVGEIYLELTMFKQEDYEEKNNKVIQTKPVMTTRINENTNSNNNVVTTIVSNIKPCSNNSESSSNIANDSNSHKLKVEGKNKISNNVNQSNQTSATQVTNGDINPNQAKPTHSGKPLPNTQNINSNNYSHAIDLLSSLKINNTNGSGMTTTNSNIYPDIQAKIPESQSASNIAFPTANHYPQSNDSTANNTNYLQAEKPIGFVISPPQNNFSYPPINNPLTYSYNNNHMNHNAYNSQMPQMPQPLSNNNYYQQNIPLYMPTLSNDYDNDLLSPPYPRYNNGPNNIYDSNQYDYALKINQEDVLHSEKISLDSSPLKAPQLPPRLSTNNDNLNNNTHKIPVVGINNMPANKKKNSNINILEFIKKLS